MPFDFDAAVHSPHRMQPGLRRLAAGTPQLSPSATPGGQGSRHLLEKLAVLQCFGPQALLAQPGFDAGPALQALAEQAAAEWPGALALDGETWTAPTLGWQLDAGLQPRQTAPNAWREIGPLLAGLAPGWRRAVLLHLALCEDFAVVDAATGALPWLAVALPSMWAPETKLGLHFAAVHAPVADNRLIVGAAPQLVALVTGGERWERFVWTVSPHPRLHAHPDRVDPARWAPALAHAASAGAHAADWLAAQAWFRSERQTFIPVPAAPGGAAQAVFTIRVDVTPLPLAISTAHEAQRLHDALASMSDAVLAYRGLGDAQPLLLRWLAARAEADAPGTTHGR